MLNDILEEDYELIYSPQDDTTDDEVCIILE